MTVHFLSIFSLAVLVFFGSVLVKITNKVSSDKNAENALNSIPAFGLGVNYASAEHPSDSGDGDGGGDGGDCDGGGGGDCG